MIIVEYFCEILISYKMTYLYTIYFHVVSVIQKMLYVFTLKSEAIKH